MRDLGIGSKKGHSPARPRLRVVYNYDAWGNITSQTGSLKNANTFTAREEEEELGLMYYRARFYDPKIGRFISQDPFSGGPDDARVGYENDWFSAVHGEITLYTAFRQPHRFNRYIYCNDNPINFVDPLGLDAFDKVADFAAGMGDALTFGLTNLVRRAFGINHITSETAYTAGTIAGTALDVAIGGGIAKKFAKKDILVLGRGPKSRLESLAAKEGGRISTTTSDVPKEIFKQNYRDMRKADKIVQYMDGIPKTLDEVKTIGGRGQYARAEKYMIDKRLDLQRKTIRKYEKGQ